MKIEEENILSINQQKKALEWYETHKSHVDRLVKITRGSYPPSLREDKDHPHLWKSEHWKWFLK